MATTSDDVSGRPAGMVIFAPDGADEAEIEFLQDRFGVRIAKEAPGGESAGLTLRLDGDGLALAHGDCAVRGDFAKLQPRIVPDKLHRELVVRAAKIKGAQDELTAIDATAGLGEDAFLLAAAGFSVQMYERDPVIAALLCDALYRASTSPGLASIVARMELFPTDSVAALRQMSPAPDVVLLDPMFPTRRKSALVKKKFQLLQQLEQPCADEEELLDAALTSGPRKVVVKRPLKGPFLAGRAPDYSLKGSSIRYDVIAIARGSAE